MEKESITAIVDNNDVQREVFKLSSVFIEKQKNQVKHWVTNLELTCSSKFLPQKTKL